MPSEFTRNRFEKSCSPRQSSSWEVIQVLSWAENSKLDPCIERYFETTHTAAATAEAPARQGTECWVQWVQMGYICWHLDWLDDSGGCKCFSVDRWGDTRHELSAVADGWMESFSKKQTLLQWPGLVISMHELIEICGLFIQMGRSGIDQGVHHNWYSVPPCFFTRVFYPSLLTYGWPVCDPCVTRILMGGYGWRSDYPRVTRGEPQLYRWMMPLICL